VPDDPVRCLDERTHRVEDGTILQPDLNELGEVPLGREPTAVAGQELLIAVVPDLVQAISDGLCRVVLPQLDPGVRASPPQIELAEGYAVIVHRQHSARGEVDAKADDLLRRDVAGSQRGGDPPI
jgi:hypothetical protein